jgi:hypothetical protein
MKKLLLIPVLTIFLQLFPAPTHAIDIGKDCGFDQINLADEVGQVFNERIEAVLHTVTSGKSLFGGLICLAIISLYLDYHRGRLDWKDFLIRIGITIFLLKNYAGPGNFRDTITNAADKAADSIRFGYPGGNPLESMFETLYSMFKNMQASGGSGSVHVINWLGNLFGIGEIGDAAHVIALFFSPAGITTILFILTTLIVAILSYVLDVGATLLILVLSLLGPIAICFGCIKSTMSVATGWFQRFVEINLWKIIYACFMVGIATVYEKLGAIAFNPQQYSGATDPLTQMTCAFSAMLLSIVVAVVSIFMLSSIPSIASAIVEGRGTGMGMTASFLVGAGSAAVMSGFRSGLQGLRQKMASGNSSSSTGPTSSGPDDGPLGRTVPNRGGSIRTRPGSDAPYRTQPTDSSGSLMDDQVSESKSGSLHQQDTMRAAAVGESPRASSDLAKVGEGSQFPGNVQSLAEKNMRGPQVERFHQGDKGTQVTTTRKQDLLGRTQYTTSTSIGSGSLTKEQTTMDPVEAAENHGDQLEEARSGGQEFAQQWMRGKGQGANAPTASRSMASSNDESLGIGDFTDADGKKHMRTVNNKTGDIMMRSTVKNDTDAMNVNRKQMTGASGNGFTTAEGTGAVLNKSAGSNQSSIAIYRTTEGIFSVQERSENGDLKRSYVAGNAREALGVRDDWKKEGSKCGVSYSSHDLRTPEAGQVPARTHQSNDGDVLITTKKGQDDYGKESYLIEKTNTKSGAAERTVASSASESEEKHNRFIEDENQIGRKFTEIRV